MKKLFKQELVEVVIPAGSTATRFAIPDQPNLRNVKLIGLEVFTSDEMNKSILSGNNVIGVLDLKKVLLTLIDYNGFEFLKNAPSIQFKTIDAVGGGRRETDFKNFVGQRVNYPKSYIDLTEAFTEENDISFLFTVIYMDRNIDSSTTYHNKK